MYLDPALATSYGLLVGGEWNEPETHEFLRILDDLLPDRFTFVDVGANIGAMALDAARLSKIRNVIAIEPNQECVRAIEKSCQLNGFTNLRVVEAAITADGKPVAFAIDRRHAILSHVISKVDTLSPVPESQIVAGLTLDGLADDVGSPCIILIDVEGSELQALRGGRKLIPKLRPLIIFEYNDVTRKHFSLAEVSDVLGPDYEMFRLNQFGRLDKQFARTWNCCAVPAATVFQDLLPHLLSPSIQQGAGENSPTHYNE
jgi:FkbM family methyltransferase